METFDHELLDVIKVRSTWELVDATIIIQTSQNIVKDFPWKNHTTNGCPS
jgi:hypothetical protein